MSTLSVPYSNLLAGATIRASEHNSNYGAIVTWAAGGIQNDNFGTMTGVVTWSVSTNALGISSTNSGTEGSAKFTQSGVLAASKAAAWITSAVAQTTGTAGLFVEFTNASSSIPAAKFVHAGSGATIHAEASGTGPAVKAKNSGSGSSFQATDGSDNVLWQMDPDGTQHGPEPIYGNLLVNSAFDFWQRGTSVTIANGISTYQADQWYGKNSLGTNGVLTFSRIAGSKDGSLYGAKLQITTAPTAAQANGCELYQVLDNLQSLKLYNKTASFSAQIKAFGNVTQIGLQFFYATSEVKLTTAIGSETLVTVNSGSFTLAKMEGIALGSSMTNAGVIGVRIRVTAVSSGNTYDLNNGFSVEQGMLNLGKKAGNFVRAFRTPDEEIAACERFYEKSYDVDVAPNTNTQTGTVRLSLYTSVSVGNGAAWPFQATIFRVRKRTAPTVTIINYAGSSNGIRIDTTDEASTAGSVCTTSFVPLNSTGGAIGTGAPVVLTFHFTADAAI